MAQSVQRLTLDLSSGFDLRVMSSSPALGSTLSMEATLKKRKKKESMVSPFYELNQLVTLQRLISLLS